MDELPEIRKTNQNRIWLARWAIAVGALLTLTVLGLSVGIYAALLTLGPLLVVGGVAALGKNERGQL